MLYFKRKLTNFKMKITKNNNKLWNHHYYNTLSVTRVYAKLKIISLSNRFSLEKKTVTIMLMMITFYNFRMEFIYFSGFFFFLKRQKNKIIKMKAFTEHLIRQLIHAIFYSLRSCIPNNNSHQTIN